MAQILTRTQQILFNKLGALSPAMQQAFEEGSLQFSDSVYYKRYEVTGAGGLLDLLYNDDAIKDGFTNISKQKIKQGCAIMIDRITMRAGYTAVANSTYNAANINYLPISQIAATESVLANSELEIDVAQLNIFQTPINSFNQESVGINGEKDGIILTAPKLITDAQEMQFRLHIPQGMTISGTENRYFVEVALRGAEVRVS